MEMPSVRERMQGVEVAAGALPRGEAGGDEAIDDDASYPPGEALHRRAVLGYVAPHEEIGVATVVCAVNAKVIPFPGLLDYRGWVFWRRQMGGRPSMKYDGVATSKKEESAMWKFTMKSLHGEGWRDQLSLHQSTILATENPKKKSDKKPPSEEAGEAAPVAAEEERVATLARLTGSEDDVALLAISGEEYAQ